MKTMPIARQHWLTKDAAGFNAVGKIGNARKQWTHSQCPRCAPIEDDSQHITKCQVTGAPEQWPQSLEQLEKWMETKNTKKT